MLESKDTKSIAIGSALVAVNIALIWLFAQTFIPALVAALFQYLIVGVIVFGAILTGGTWLSAKGIREDNTKLAWFGVTLLMACYGAFGSLALSFVESAGQGFVLGVTAAVTVVIASLCAGYVYGTKKNFSKFRNYATYCFLGVLLFAFVGTFVGALAIIGFALATTGFLLYLIYEIWAIRTSPQKVMLNGIGIYSAFMGVFVHVLRIVVEMYLRRKR